MNEYLVYILTKDDADNQVVRVKANNRHVAVLVAGGVLRSAGNFPNPNLVVATETKLMRRG